MAEDLSVVRTVSFDYSYLTEGERLMDELEARARKVSEALKAAGVPHAVIGGLAVRAHVFGVAPEAVMTTRDIDLLLRRKDIPRAAEALSPLGFVQRDVLGIPAFVVKGGKFRDAVHLVLTGENLKANSPHPPPDFDEQALMQTPLGFPVLDLPRLLFMKLTSFRHKDIVHVQSLLELGLITPDVEAPLPDDLKARLAQVREDTRKEQVG